MAIVTSPTQYEALLQHMHVHGPQTTLHMRRSLAAAAFAMSSVYDTAIAAHFSRELSQSAAPVSTEPPAVLSMTYQACFRLKYGCNPHQSPAGIYRPLLSQQSPFRVVNGTPGYINLLDACNAWQLVRELRTALGNVC